MWICQECGYENEDYYLNCMHCTSFHLNQQNKNGPHHESSSKQQLPNQKIQVHLY